MPRRQRTSLRGDLARLIFLALIVAFFLAVQQDWLGARDLHASAAEWFGERFSESITGVDVNSAAPS